MTHLPVRMEINIAAIPVRGFGGFCILVASLICAASLPPARWFMLAGIAAGVVFGVARIATRGDGGEGRTHTLWNGTGF
jgi:membrane protease YdiL (CAAX protease family)